MTVALFHGVSDEQAMLLDASVQLMDTVVPIATVRQCADGADYDDDRYRHTAATLGWFGLLATEADGGGSASANGVADAAILAAERGARLQPGPFAGHSAVVHALSRSGRASDVLHDLIAGQTWASWAPAWGSSCVLTETSDGGRLNGAIDLIADIASCGWLMVTVRSGDGSRLALVPTSASGVEITPLRGLDVTRRWARVSLTDVAVANGHLIDVDGDGDGNDPHLLDRLIAITSVLTAADTVGAMHAVHSMAVQYSKDRIAFGRPIGSFQAIKHLLADDSLWLEMAKALVASAATAVGKSSADGAQLAHAAKAFIAERGVELAHDSFQVFGGIGYTWEHDQHLFLRRITADAVAFGSVADHRSLLLDAAGVAR